MPLVPPYIEALRPYEAGRTAEEIRRAYGVETVVKLASNENPLGPSPLAIAAIRRELESLNVYPDGGSELRRGLGEEVELDVGNLVLVGGGAVDGVAMLRPLRVQARDGLALLVGGLVVLAVERAAAE